MNRGPQVAVVTRPVPHQVKAAAPLAAGLRRHGFRVRETFDRCPPEEIVTVWGWGWAKEIRAKFPDKIVLCLDHGYFDPRKETVCTGWQGLNGFGEHPVIVDNGDRLHETGWFDKLESPFRPKTGNALILGQVYGDAMIVDAVEDYSAWLQARAEELSAEGYKVLFRPHPVQARNGNDQRYGTVGRRTPPGNTLWQDVANADVVLAMNSNGLLDALMLGHPDIRLYNKGSMLWPITTNGRANPDKRFQLASRLAWCQWLPEEVGSDTWMELHRPILERVISNGGLHTPWHTQSF